MTDMSNHFERSLPRAAALVALLLALAPAQRAQAFCGFYVTGADTQLYANATMVVLMRDGSRTVLSMQNNYQGPPEEFALVIPVPTVLQKEQVKVLPKDVFERVDKLGAPRLVEYWEVDPCRPNPPLAAPSAATPRSASAGSAPADQVRIEAQFAVGEYDVVVLSADDSSALDTWLRSNDYNIPSGAAPVLEPYVAAGMKFFVAKVDPSRVTFKGEQAALSPLRFHYDSPDFSLPVRLGLLNSSGTQDLIVNILAQERYEVANYANLTVPTNIRVRNEVRDDFASFYEALFARVLEQDPRTVVTEYAWSSSSCDPCPTPPLTASDLLTLGADVLQTQTGQKPAAGSGGSAASPPIAPAPIAFSPTLTRLHARYSKDSLGDDLVFKQAPAILGGRDIPDRNGELKHDVQTGAGVNNFQGRYVILHPWQGAPTCENPQRGLWGGPNGGPGSGPMTQAPANSALSGAPPAAGDLPSLLAESIPSLSVTAKVPVQPIAGTDGSKPAAGSGGSSAKPKPSATGGTPAAESGGRSGGSIPVANTPPKPKSDSGCAVHEPRASDRAALPWVVLVLMVLVGAKRRTRRGRA